MNITARVLEKGKRDRQSREEQKKQNREEK